MWFNYKLFSSLNVINAKRYPYVTKGILRHDHYSSDTKIGTSIVAIRRITYSYHAWKTIVSISCDSNI